QAIARMRRALFEYQVAGVRTTLPFARWLMQHPRFIEGDLSTDFVAEEWDTRNVDATNPVAMENETTLSPTQVAALVGSLVTNEHRETEKLRRQPVVEASEAVSRWRHAGRREALR
ncbi:MAG TPA: acetyl-CoA carboxylase biotin carboxylase subunit, partial [Ktedonobacteraceae bacterium]